jgi:RNA polymerase sigma-70 factor, ECF subfamily
LGDGERLPLPECLARCWDTLSVHSAPDHSTWFVQRLADGQRGLYAYILQMLPNRADADDVLQRTNLVMWTKREEFVEGSNFGAWAARIAYYEVLTWRKHQARDRLCFDDVLVEQLSYEATNDAGWMETFVQMLRRCMDQLSPSDRELLEMQYVDDLRPRDIATRLGRSSGAIAQAMHRIRKALLNCIDAQDHALEEHVR